jgi:hypothetical protein
MIPLFKAVALTLLFASASITNAQTLIVQVLNGKSGKAVANEHVNLFRTEGFGDLAGNRGVAGFTTDANGMITTSEIASEVHAFFASVDWHRQCTKRNPVAFSLQEIFREGRGERKCV